MYIPASNAESNPEVILDFVANHPFGLLVTAGSEAPFATHLPFVLDRSRGAHGVLQGHIARANPHHRQAGLAPEALVVFSGPDAYITPSWYPAKAEHGRVVPTWNYLAVHVYGTLTFIEDAAFLRAHLAALTRQSESGREAPWAIEDAPREYIEQQQKAIVGLELTITRLEGKWKMSQNRSSADIDGVVRGLSASPAAADRQVAEIVEARRPERPRS